MSILKEDKDYLINLTKDKASYCGYTFSDELVKYNNDFNPNPDTVITLCEDILNVCSEERPRLFVLEKAFYKHKEIRNKVVEFADKNKYVIHPLTLVQIIFLAIELKHYVEIDKFVFDTLTVMFSYPKGYAREQIELIDGKFTKKEYNSYSDDKHKVLLTATDKVFSNSIRWMIKVNHLKVWQYKMLKSRNMIDNKGVDEEFEKAVDRFVEFYNNPETWIAIFYKDSELRKNLEILQ